MRGNPEALSPLPPRALRDGLPRYAVSEDRRPLWVCGGALEALEAMPEASVDCALTSPPYWRQRRYDAGGLGQEARWQDYLAALLEVFGALRRVLRPTGSLWLNLGDVYHDKRLLGLPWRLALAMGDEQGWVLRNEVIWNKVKGGPDPSQDRLRGVHEPLFHFTQRPRGYFYDVDAVRAPSRPAEVRGGRVVSGTGVSGVRYRRQLELSTHLSEEEKAAALAALEQTLAQVAAGELSDFRMVLRRQQRVTHSESAAVSGRARELAQRGFYFLRYHPKGAKPSDVWDIMPEGSQGRRGHFAPFPEDLCRLPLLATCPVDGVALDPFCGTGTTNLVAWGLGRRSVGVDLSEAYLRSAAARVAARESP